MNKIENNNLKINEIEDNCKIEFKTIHNTISDLECDNNLKLMNVKNELSKAISQQVNTVAERVIMTRDVSSEVELETFSCDNKRVHPMPVSYTHL